VPSPASYALNAIFGAAEFWAAIVGAIVGGLISLMAQRYEIAEQRKQREEDKKQLQKMLAFSVSIKMNTIYTDFFRLNQHLEESVKIASVNNVRPCNATNMLVALPDVITFSMEERSCIYQIGPIDLFNALLVMDRYHRTAILAFENYNSLKLELEGSITNASLKTNISGQVVSSETSDQSRKKLELRMNGADSLLSQIRGQLSQHLSESKSCALRLHERLVEAGLMTGTLNFDSE
jgi:hypothetical protein